MGNPSATFQVLVHPTWWVPAVAALGLAIYVRKSIKHGDAQRADVASRLSTALVLVSLIETSTQRAKFFSRTDVACANCWGILGSWIFDLLLTLLFCVVVFYSAREKPRDESIGDYPSHSTRMKLWRVEAAVLISIAWSACYFQNSFRHLDGLMQMPARQEAPP